MGENAFAKVTISLPQPMLALADRLAIEQATTRSGAIASLLEQEDERRIEALMVEGYREMADENLAEAEEAPSVFAWQVGPPGLSAWQLALR